MKISPKVCAVCGLLLDRDVTKQVWVHGQDEIALNLTGKERDHLPVPVDFDELKHPGAKCDFCNEVQPIQTFNTLPAEDFVSLGFGFEANWAVCARCTPYVKRRAWGELANATRPPGSLESVLTVMLWIELEKHITGRLRPYRPEDRMVEE